MASNSNRCPRWSSRTAGGRRRGCPTAREEAHGAEDDEGYLLDADAGKLRRLGIAAHGVDVAAQDRLIHDEIVYDHEDEHDDDRPGKAVVASEDPGDRADDDRHEDELEDEEVGGQDLEVIGLLALPLDDRADDEPDDGDEAEEQGQLVDVRKERRVRGEESGM